MFVKVQKRSPWEARIDHWWDRFDAWLLLRPLIKRCLVREALIIWVYDKVLDFGSHAGLDHQDVLGKSSLHKCQFAFLELLARDADLLGNQLLAFNDQCFGVSEVFCQGIEILLWLLEQGSLLYPCLASQLMEFSLYKIKAPLNNLHVSLHADHIMCTWQILDLHIGGNLLDFLCRDIELHCRS